MASEERARGEEVRGEAFIAVDAGNTRLKATVFLHGEIVGKQVFATEDVEGILTYCERQGVGSGVMAGTGHIDPRLAETLRNEFSGDFLAVTRNTHLPIGISYDSFTSLGLDRKATAVAAGLHYPERRLLVIDAGTALTTDLIINGRFAGGNISPGLRMRFVALNAETALLPLVESERGEYLPSFGRSTREAILGGVGNGFMDEIAGAIRRAQCVESIEHCILTGGDAPYIREYLDPALFDGKLTIEYDPHLLAKGLREIYLHHEDEC